LVGETQERFVWAVPSRVVDEVLTIYNDAFDLPGIYPGACAAVVGSVQSEPDYRVKWKGQPIVDLPLALLKETPVLERPTKARPVSQDPGEIVAPSAWPVFIEQLLEHPALCSRAHIYRHYDAEVRGEALVRPGEADAGVCRPIPENHLGIAVTLDGNGRWCDLDPYHGAVASVLEAVRNIVAVGARPRALTDCLNFGSPEDPECLWEFEQCLRGIRDASIGLGLPGDAAEPLPIVSGNVSFYNQSATGRRIHPTPILACLGTLDDWRKCAAPRFETAGNHISLISGVERAWGGSAALDLLGGRGVPPRPQIAAERQRIWGMLELLEQELVGVCHDIGEGGLLVSLIESLLDEEGPTGRGVEIDLSGLPLPPTEALLTEDGGFIFEVAPDREESCDRSLGRRGVERYAIGVVTGSPRLVVRSDGETLFDLEVERLWERWARKLGRWIEGGAS
jgi:phosphoribosylformylglycinamidine synthase